MLLTRQRDVTLFADARLDFLVFDEAHTFTGAQGAETACLIRCLRAFCDREGNKTVCVATSATIVDPGAPDAAREFASRFFGVPKESVATVGEAYEPEVWASGRTTPAAPAVDANLLLSECVKAVEVDDGGASVRAVFKKLAGTTLPDGPWPEALHAALSKNEIAFQLTTVLVQARRLGTNYREPARPVRAPNMADVHVLAQDMVHHSERPRLLIFCDNRQDAAFQAGWMKDHARRFRLRALMAEGLSNNPMSVGDLSLHLDDVLNKDESLSRALVPEVWQVVRKEGGGGRHEEERKKFLRIQVLREVTPSSRQALGLEPWGRMKVEYLGLDAGLPWIQKNALGLKMPAEDLREGVVSLLDYLRRKRVLHDPDREIFGKYWMDGDLRSSRGTCRSWVARLGRSCDAGEVRSRSSSPSG